jgi:pyruvate/2-oxoglutarate dehydrogenase complex dihydrolipoamide acyltransferase (E2) component
MAAGTEVRVPDIGDFKNVEVIEVLVKPGDAVSKEQSLITLESDKATMEIPSPDSGVVKELRIKVGDKVSQGSPILLMEAREARTEAPDAAEGAGSADAGRPRAGDWRRRGVRRGGARRRARRLFGGVPRRRPRAQDRAGRALPDARRRVPQRGLHPVQGAAAHRRRHRRRQGARRRTASRSASPSSISRSCASSRTRWSES